MTSPSTRASALRVQPAKLQSRTGAKTQRTFKRSVLVVHALRARSADKGVLAGRSDLHSAYAREQARGFSYRFPVHTTFAQAAVVNDFRRRTVHMHTHTHTSCVLLQCLARRCAINNLLKAKYTLLHVLSRAQRKTNRLAQAYLIYVLPMQKRILAVTVDSTDERNY